MQNPIGEADLEWILHRNCEGTEQLQKQLVENKESAIESLVGSQGFVNADSGDLFLLTCIRENDPVNHFLLCIRNTFGLTVQCKIA